MAKKPPNQSGTKEGSTKPTPAQAKAELARRKGLKDWGDGSGRVHTISLGQHKENVQAKQTGIPLGSVTQPLTGAQAYAQANAQANSVYGPQIRASQQMYANAPTWYDNYVAGVKAGQAGLAAQSAPILNTAQAAVTNAGATAPGLDPSSPQFAKEQQAALGRQTMAQDSANYLGGVAQAGQNYLAGQASIAQRELPQVQAGLLSQRAGYESDRAGKAAELYSGIRTNEQNAEIARQTLGLNTAQAAADTDLKRGVDPVTGKPLPVDAPTGYGPGAPGLNSYGFTSDEWSGMSETAKAKARAGKGKSGSGGLTEAQKQAKADRDAKHSQSVQATSNKLISRATDAVGAWNTIAKQKFRDPPTIDPKTKKEVPSPWRKPTADEVRTAMIKAGYTSGEVHIALLLRVGKPMDAAALQYIKAQGARLNHLPKGWVPKAANLPGTTGVDPSTGRPG